MYNGIGLPTPRGSGTNGYVQRNMAHLKKSRQMRPDIVSKPDSKINESKSMEIIMHERKRKIESRCLKLRDELTREGWREERIEEEVDHYRKRKLDELSMKSGLEQEDKLKRSFGLDKRKKEERPNEEEKRRATVNEKETDIEKKRRAKR